MKKWSKVSKKTFNAILIIELFFVAGILIFTINDIYSNDFGLKTSIFIVIFLCIGVILPIVISPLLKRSFQEIEDFDNSTEYVRQHLSEKYRIEVMPIKDEPQHEEYFLTKELCMRAKFYAQIMNDGTILISLKFNGENEYVPYKSISSKIFETYFKVLDS